MKSARFCLGRIVATPAVLREVVTPDIISAIARHSVGDWGELSAPDCQANNAALANGGRLLSAYSSAQGVRFWIITEADRSTTTVLLPDDY